MNNKTEDESKCCGECGRPLPKAPRTIVEEIEEYRNMPPATRALINKLGKALIESGATITIDC